MITLSKSGDAIQFTFVDNGHYLYNGTIDVPVNSLSLVTDESNMATFKKSATNDIFISALYSDFGMTKAELETWYKNNMVGGGISSGDVQSMIDESTANYFDGVEYDSGTTRINFKHGNTIKGYVDASAFIVDGMIDDVRIETISGVSYLTIDFNTASGKQDIYIPLTDIFNPSNYYDKTEIDGLMSAFTTALNTCYANGTYWDMSGRPIKKVTLRLKKYGTNNYDAVGFSLGSNLVYGAEGQQTLSVSGLVETSAITTSITSSSTDAQVPSAKAVYDALESGGGGIDSGTVQTMIDESISGKQDTLSAGTGIDITDNVISATGGGGGEGKAVEAGRGIDVASGESAYTVSFNLPISAGTGNGALIIASDTNDLNNKATGDYAVSLNGGGFHPNYATGNHSLAEGANTKAFGECCHAEGYNTSAGTNSYPFTSQAHAEGYCTKASGDYSHAEGYRTKASGSSSHAEGYYTIANNDSEHASGKYNVSNTGSTDADKTLFSVGNGTANNARHNAFEIRQNGDIYLTKDGQDVKLQDQLGGSSITVDTVLDSGSTNPVENRVIYNKIDEVEQVTARALNALNDRIAALEAIIQNMNNQ